MIKIPFDPLPVGGIVYDTNGTTRLANATVVLQNLRTLDKGVKETESDGSYAFDLSNTNDFPTGYEDKDDLIFYVSKTISAKAVKFAMDTASVNAPNPIEKNLTVKLYIDKDIYPLPIDKRDSEMRVFEPGARATRIIPVDDTGTTYNIIGKRATSTSWDLVLPNGTKIGEFDSSGNLSISGEVSVLQTF